MNIKAAEEKGEVRRGQVTILSSWAGLFWERGYGVNNYDEGWRTWNIVLLVMVFNDYFQFPPSFVQVVSHCCFAHEAPIPRGSVDLVHLPRRFSRVLTYFKDFLKYLENESCLAGLDLHLSARHEQPKRGARLHSSSTLSWWPSSSSLLRACSIHHHYIVMTIMISFYSLLVTFIIIIIMSFSLLNVGQRK